MTFDEYQMYARETALYNTPIIYPTLGLCGKVGEYANKMKEVFGDNNGVVSKEMYNSLLNELGDVLWYVSACASDLGMDLNSVAEVNIEKIRQKK